MEGHSSGTIDCKHAGAQRDVILECPDWICNNIQVGYLYFSVIQNVFCVWFESTNTTFCFNLQLPNIPVLFLFTRDKKL